MCFCRRWPAGPMCWPLPTSDDFQKGPAISLERDDVILFPTGDHVLVIAKPSFRSLLAEGGTNSGFRVHPVAA